MNNCAICHGQVNVDASCENCNPFTKTRWSRKLTVAIAGLASIVSLWFVFFLVALAGQTISTSVSPNPVELGVLGSAASAAALLLLGLGGSVEATAEKMAVANLSFPNLVIPILFWLLLRFFAQRFLARENKNVSNGILFASGSVAALVALTALNGSSQLIAGQNIAIGFNSLIPIFVVASMSYVSFSGVSSWPFLKSVEGNFKQYIGSVNRFRKVLWRLAVVTALYLALIMGTGLIDEAPLWSWILGGLALLYLMPTAAFVIGPFFVGVAISHYDIFQAGAMLATLRRWDNDGQWLSWLIVGIALLIALASALKSAANSTADRNGWWRSTAIGVGLGLATSLLGSINISVNFAPFSYSQSFGLHAVALVVVFGLVGFVRGLFIHPIFHSIAESLNESPGSQVRRLMGILALQEWSLRKAIESYYTKQHFLVRKLAKYTSVLAAIGLVFALGHPLAFVTQPFYDNSGTGTSRFEHSLKSGDVKDIKQYFAVVSSGKVDAVVGSSGLGEKSDLKVESISTSENTTKLSWNSGASYIEIASTKSSSKSPFLGIIPQWDAFVTKSSFPSFTAKFGDQPVFNILSGKQVVALNRVFFIPGKVSWKPEGDRQKFVLVRADSFDSTKAAALKLDYSLNSGIENAVTKSLSDAFKADFTKQCKLATLTPVSKVEMGKYYGWSGFVQLKASGKGTCDTKTKDTGVINFTYSSVGTYSAEAQKWKWAFNFK